MPLITKDTDYAIRSLAYFVERPKEVVSVREISDRLTISHPYLRKLLQILARAGMLESVKGKNGGFRLRCKPEQISIKDLVNLFQENIGIRHCVVRSEDCPNINSCLLHEKLGELETFFNREIGVITINDLVAAGRRD